MCNKYQLLELWRKYDAATDAYLQCTDTSRLPALEAEYVRARDAYDAAEAAAGISG